MSEPSAPSEAKAVKSASKCPVASESAEPKRVPQHSAGRGRRHWDSAEYFANGKKITSTAPPVLSSSMLALDEKEELNIKVMDASPRDGHPMQS